ncbi:phenylacetate--CoA ligase family protein [Pseudoduganella albidiflava]|uniref:Capsular polysaccharide biosynthesis protein n=1 Tax=Pseudoduganella albidiflava TaxID=321983 RepID=A0A411X2B0_9BURK|nr:phenylacetate--CoA ligase family protein [Pseudoduganella albidiflava]QBI03012.1 phenylacetate--CoA ligase family protein [Pseudoduganella albidiflava]GGY58243.1 capsular polysaccharide biosynthesis protein [Pseudoduganella albidiflava]
MNAPNAISPAPAPSLLATLRFRLIDLVRGTNTLELLDTLRRQQYESPEKLEAQAGLARTRYLEELRTLPMFSAVRSFDELPVTNKKFINAHREELRNPHYKGKVVRKKTGGSTGEPLVYYTSSDTQSYLWAGLLLSWEVAGYRLGDPVAFLSGSSLSGTGMKQQAYYALLNVRIFSAFDMSTAAMTQYAESIQSGGYRLIYGYASAVHRLACHLNATNTRLQHRLRGIVCTAEMLTPAMRKDIERAFGVPCYSQYGCNDAGVSAFECENQQGFHLLSMRCHTEVLEDNRLVATDLVNRAMYMPRHDTGDLVRMSEQPCSCGRGLPLIAEVLGRQNDVVVDPRGNAVHSEFFTHLFREDARIERFQVVFDDRTLTVNLHGASLHAAQLEAQCEAYRQRILASLAFDELRFVCNEPFVTQANSKHRFIIRRPAA